MGATVETVMERRQAKEREKTDALADRLTAALPQLEAAGGSAVAVVTLARSALEQRSLAILRAADVAATEYLYTLVGATAADRGAALELDECKLVLIPLNGGRIRQRDWPPEPFSSLVCRLEACQWQCVAGMLPFVEAPGFASAVRTVGALAALTDRIYDEGESVVEHAYLIAQVSKTWSPGRGVADTGPDLEVRILGIGGLDLERIDNWSALAERIRQATAGRALPGLQYRLVSYMKPSPSTAMALLVGGAIERAGGDVGEMYALVADGEVAALGGWKFPPDEAPEEEPGPGVQN